MKRISVYFLFAGTLAICVLVNEFLMTSYDWTHFYRAEYARKVDLLPDEAVIAAAYLHADENLDHLVSFLNSRQRTGAVDFWALYHSGEVFQTNIDIEELKNLTFKLGDVRRKPDKIFCNIYFFSKKEDLFHQAIIRSI